MWFSPGSAECGSSSDDYQNLFNYLTLFSTSKEIRYFQLMSCVLPLGSIDTRKFCIQVFYSLCTAWIVCWSPAYAC